MTVTYNHAKNVANNITSFYFEAETPLKYIAGQFIELTLPHKNPDTRGIKRWFTLSSSPTETSIAITTKKSSPSSSFKQQLWSLQPGDIVEMSSPMGDFVLPKDKSIPLLFMAGGIGVTPFRSMVQWLSDKHLKRQIQLIYVARDNKDLAFLPLFRSYNLSLDTIIGKILTAQDIVRLSNGIKNKLVYMSGPEPMIESLFKQFNEIGTPNNQLIGDYFPNYDF